jgi:hypothetical protein
MSDEYAWVMLKKYDPSVGNVRERFKMPAKGWDGLLFIPEEVHLIGLEQGEWLYNNIRQLDGVGAEKSPRAFHIWYSAAEAKRAVRDLKLQRMRRVRRTDGPEVTNAPPPLHEEPVLTNIGDPEPDHELELEPEIPEESVDLGTLDAEDDFSDLVPDIPTAKPKAKPKAKPMSRSKRKPVRRKKK